VNEDEYKVMGLAAYGRPTLTEAVRKLIRRTPDGAFTLDMDFFEYQTTAARSYSQRFVDLFGRPRNPHEPIDFDTVDGRRFADCAASVQRVLEDTLVDIARALHEETGAPDLCLAGGVALNGVANARILAESGFERVFVPSAPGDSGCALGAALYADRIYLGNADRDVPDHPFWVRRSTRKNSRERRARTTRPSSSSTTPRSWNGWPTSSPPAVSSVGWMARPSSGPARSATAASWRHRIRSRCATGSIATSSIARSSGRSRPS